MVRALALLTVIAGLLIVSLGAAHAQDVGIIKGRDGCPPGSSELIWAMDNEDHNEASAISGWVGATTLDAAGNLAIYFCRIPATQLANAPGPFAVLALGTCPAGTWQVRRTFDAEDHNNVSEFRPTAAAALPNAMTYGFTYIYFCVYQGVSGGSFPDLQREYGVFSDHWNLPGALAFGEVYSDDEDDVKGIGTNYDDWIWPRGWTQFVHPPHQVAGVTCCWDGVKEVVPNNGWTYSWSRSPQLSFLRGEADTVLSIARVGNTVARPQAVCTATPNTGTDSIYTAFDGRQSFARGGKYLVAYEWTFPAGSTSNNPGPHYMSYVVAPGSAQEFVATLRVTDNGGEVSYASCGVVVYSSVPCPGGNCEIE